MSENNRFNWETRYQPPTDSIDTGRSAQWRYSPRFVYGQYDEQTRVELTGKRIDDYDLAEDDTGGVHIPKDTVWHHVHDFDSTNNKCTMQLVKWDTHCKTIPHAGGCKQYSEVCGGRYRGSNSRDMTFYDKMYVPTPYTQEELDAFCNEFNIEFTSLLMEIYTGKVDIRNYTFSSNQLDVEPQMDFVAPLKDLENGASIENMLSSKWIRDMSITEKWIPFAGDATGNIFFCTRKDTIIYLDHESGDLIEFKRML